MIAVCGIGRPSGWRNIAVTANQSAMPPTNPALALACSSPAQNRRAAADVDSAAISISSPVAKALCRTRSRRSSASGSRAWIRSSPTGLGRTEQGPASPAPALGLLGMGPDAE